VLQVLRLGSAPPWSCHGSDFTPSTLVRKKMLHATLAQTSCAEAWQWRSYCNVHVYLSRYTDAVSSPAGYHGKHHRMWAKASTQSRLQAAYSNSARKLPGMGKQTSCSGTGLGYLMGLCLA